MIARDVLLTRLASGRLHVAPISPPAVPWRSSQWAKEEGINVTCETAPHYFALTDGAVAEQFVHGQDEPSPAHRGGPEFDHRGPRSGAIDVIATDHAPHPHNEKMQEIEYAPFGIIGLETMVPLIMTVLVRENGFSYLEAFGKVTVNPARILSLDKGELTQGKLADITIVNPEKKVRIDEHFLLSKSKNSPFLGQDLYGSVEYTICNGNIVYSGQ